MEKEVSKKRELETTMVDKVGEVISAIRSAKHVDQVICSLHSIVALLFPIDPSLLSGLVLCAIPQYYACLSARVHHLLFWVRFLAVT